MNRKKIGRWGCIVLVGIFILLCGFIYNWQSISCRFSPPDPNVEVVISACRNPVLHSVSPDGKYMVYSAEGGTWLRNLVTDEEQPLSTGGRVWLSERWLLQETDPTIHHRQFWIFDVTDGTQTPLQWVQGLADATSRRGDGILVFSPKVLVWFQQAETIYYIPQAPLNIAVALASNFKDQPEAGYVLATPRSHQSGDDEAISTFLTKNALSYIEIKSEYYYPLDSLPSHNGQFVAFGTSITTSDGQSIVQAEEFFGTIHGWSYDDSGVYYQLPRLSNGPNLMPLFRVGKAQPILKLKVPETYLDASITSSA
jgi:hypothetical protein